MVYEAIINGELIRYVKYRVINDLKGNEIETYELLDGSYLTIWNDDKDEVDYTRQPV